MNGTAGGITAVLPTYNRAAALRETIEDYLSMVGIDHILIIDDGSTDETPELLATLTDTRIRVIRHEVNRGLPAARNTGARGAETEWVLYVEDDCQMPPDYGVELRRVALEHRADIVAAPWLNVDPSEYGEALAAGQSAPVSTIDFHTYVGSFPPYPVESPFLCALSLVNRRVFEAVRYDESFRGASFREETDFYLRATAQGFRCVLTPTTASCQVRRWTGGTRRQHWRYEASVVLSNWRFLRRHRLALARYGVASIYREQAAFTARRARGTVRHYLVAIRDAVRDRKSSTGVQ